MIRQAISCDICGTEKKQTNHWFVAFDQGGELRISGWTSRNRLRPGSRHLCGQTCMHKLVDDFMARAIAVRAPAGVSDEAAAAVFADDIPAAEPAPVRAAATGLSHAPLGTPAISAPDRAIPMQQPQERPPADRSLDRGLDRSLDRSLDRALDRSPDRTLDRSLDRASGLRSLASADSSLTAVHDGLDLDFESSARLISSPAPPAPRRAPVRALPELVAMPGRPHLEELPPGDEPPRFASRNWRAEAWDRERERELRASRSTGTSSRRRSGS